MIKVNLCSTILPHFRPLFRAIQKNKYFRIVLKGGRSSGKSLFIALSIVIGVMTNKRSAIAIVRNDNSVTDILANVFLKAINILGVGKYWRYVQKPCKFILLDENGKDTDVSIICKGADNPEKLKGTTPKRGSFIYLWIEEATNFDTWKAIANIESTMCRGDIKHCTSIITYNPKQNTGHFLNMKFNTIDTDESDSSIEIIKSYTEDIETNEKVRISDVSLDDDLIVSQCVMHCTYKSLIKYGHKDWISPTDLVAIKQGERDNSDYYNWYYLGEACGSSSINVFRNIKDWDGNTEGLALEKINRGCDCSNGGPDPWHYGEWYFDRKNRNIYCLSEFRATGGTSIEGVASGIKKINKMNMPFYVDSAVPTFRTLLINSGLANVLPAKKAPDSVRAGVIWLQSVNGIYICEKNTPYTYKEFKGYEFVIDKYDEVTTELKDKDNHSIDTARYALSMDIKYE